MSLSSVCCPHCGRALLTIDLPQGLQDQATSSSIRSGGDESLLLRIHEVARLLGVSRSTMYQLIARGEVPVFRIWRSVRVARASLDKFLRPPGAS
jgi:excisionase family DNA binding protein